MKKTTLAEPPPPGSALRSSASPTGRKLTRTAGNAALLCVLSMSSVQFGAALSAPTMNTFGSFSTTWIRLSWAAIVLALIQRIPLGLAVAIDFLGPLTVATIGVRRMRALIWPLLALAGVLLLSRDRAGWVGEPLGVLLAFGAATGWGIYIVLMKKTGAMFSGLEGLSVSLIAAAIAAMPFGLLQSGGHIPLAQVGATAGLALLVPLLPYALEMVALRHMPASSFGILMSVEPAIGALAGFIVLHQPMTAMQLAGMFLVVCASIGVVVLAP
jgi:inner membrane transporter RhtA